ncbi:MAG TPA: 16S rRNA (cytidine(1402)-2'-O)-methyltransferase [Bacteroidetes bacterium]|nr:16S rRNA (cytidine(1402)-2'-O)-methyltransferase [Bacteroidota bacterium]
MATLYVIGTPIGNLNDISKRAIEVLNEVSGVACEDTRTTGFLLQHLGLKKQLFSFHAHNEHAKIDQLINYLVSGNDVALVSDAGMPGISDPGFLAVRKAHETGITVSVIPGPSAVLTALVASGLPSDRFCFEGFLPQKKGRKTRLELLKQEDRTMVLFESPHRIVKLIKECIAIFGPERLACFGRELTKKFEENKRGTLAELLISLETRPSIKGEFVLVVAGNTYTEK